MSAVYAAEQWVEAFAVTLWVEVPVYLLFLRNTKLTFTEAFSVAMLVNIFTHPALWYVFPKWSVFPAPFDQRFHLLLNLSIGGRLVGTPDDKTVFPQKFEIDYVRVFQHDSK